MPNLNIGVHLIIFNNVTNLFIKFILFMNPLLKVTKICLKKKLEIFKYITLISFILKKNNHD